MSHGTSTVPYCFFNLLSPILDVAYGFLGFKVPETPATTAPEARERGGMAGLPEVRSPG